MIETVDPELWAMRHMAVDELDRFTTILETIEREQAWFDNFKSETDPNARLVALPAKQREDLMAHMSRWEEALDEKTATIGKYADQAYAWGELIDYSLAAIESLFDQGKLNREFADRSHFWRLVYHRILIDRGREIGRDLKFRNVKILEVLTEWVADCLPGFAERFREEGNPILAQVLEALADKRSQS
jgi:hypothetical protein